MVCRSSFKSTKVISPELGLQPHFTPLEEICRLAACHETLLSISAQPHLYFLGLNKQILTTKSQSLVERLPKATGVIITAKGNKEL